MTAADDDRSLKDHEYRCCSQTDGVPCEFQRSGGLALASDADWQRDPPSGDVPWEVTGDAYGDSFDARF